MVYVVTAVAIIAAIPIALLLAWSLFAWRVPGSPPKGSARRRVIVAVPAHNEGGVIGSLLSDLAAQTYPTARYEVHVIADRCTDGTVDIASQHARVHARTDGTGTKGAAVSWFLDRIEVGAEDFLVVLDADNRVLSGFLREMVDAADAGNSVVQAYVEPLNPDDSPVALASAISWWLSNRLIELPRCNVGASCGISGTGFGVVGALIDSLRADSDTMVEDQVIGDRLAILGVHVEWLHRVRVLDEKPSTLETLARQRARWAEGERRRRSASLSELLGGGGPWSVTRVDRILRLVLPGRIMSLTVLLGIAVVAMIWPSILAFSPWWIFGLALAVAAVAVVGLLVEGAGVRRVVKIPLLFVFALLWIPERIIGRAQGGWFHTPHRGGADD